MFFDTLNAENCDEALKIGQSLQIMSFQIQ